MKPEKPPLDSIEADIDPQNFHYDQTLLETQEKCLPLLERLVVKFSEYNKICTALKEKRPPLEWLRKLGATCEKIEKKMTAQFFEKLDDSERKNNTFGSSEQGNNEIAIKSNKREEGIITQKHSRWDVKPEKDVKKEERSFKEKHIYKYYERRSLKPFLTYKNRHPIKRGLAVVDLTKNEETYDRLCSQRRYNSYVREGKEQDLDVEIIASTAGLNPLRKARSQTQFDTLEEVNTSPFYKRFTSDNMALDFRAANLKYGTVYDLVKNKAQSTELHHQKLFQRRCEEPRRPKSNEQWSQRCDYEINNYQTEFYDKKTPWSHMKSNETLNKNYERLKIDVKFCDRNKESNTSNNSRQLDKCSSKGNYEKAGNEFQGEMPYYKQNISGNPSYSCSEKSFKTQSPKDPASLSTTGLYPVPNKSFLSSKNVANPQFNEVGYPQQQCSFHCNCCKNSTYFSGIGTSYQPTVACAVSNSNYAFLPGQYFSNQPVISPLNKNLPTPFPTFTVPNLTNGTLTASIPYNSNNKSGYSIPVFCNEENQGVNKASATLMTWNTRNDQYDKTSRPKDPRTDLLKSRFTQSTSNLTKRFSTMDSVLTHNPCLSGISEERFSQSCTFLRPDNLYKDFRCHSDENKDNSFESLKSFGLANNTTSMDSPINFDPSKKSTLSKNTLTRDITFKIVATENNNYNENSLNRHAINHTNKKEGILNEQHIKTLQPEDNYISPLSNLYNDGPTSKLEDYNNATNKLLENRKRKYEEVLWRNSCETDNKRKKIGKVEPMNKTYLNVVNKEDQTCKINHKSENSLRSEGELSESSSRVKNPRKSNDINLSLELWEKIESPRWIEKDSDLDSLRINTKVTLSNPNNELPHKHELHSENILNLKKNENTFLREFSFRKDNMSDASNSFKNQKEQKSKSQESLTNVGKPTKNANKLEKKRSSAGKFSMKQKLKSTSSTKSDTKKEQEKELLCQKVKLDCKGKEIEKISSKRFERNPQLNSSTDRLLKPDNSSDSQNIMSITKENVPEKSSISNKSINIKKKTKSKHSKENSIETGICLEEHGSTSKLPNKKNKDNKISKSVNEKSLCTKDKSSDKNTSVFKSKDDDKITHRSKKLSDQGQNSERLTLVINKRNETLKTSTTQKNQYSSIDDSTVLKSTSPAKINNKNHYSETATQKENVLFQDKLITINNSILGKHDSKTHTQSKITSQNVSYTPKESVSEKKSSKKPNSSKTKDCSVVLKREKSVIIDKYLVNKTYKTAVDVEKDVDVKTFPGKIQSYHKEKKENSTDTQKPIDINQRSDKKGDIDQKQQMFLEEADYSKDISNYNNDKVKDLVLRMKSLSQSEALKVITEFASILKVQTSQENMENMTSSKDQKVISKGEDTENTTCEIKIKNEIIYDYPEPLKCENNKKITSKANVYNYGTTGKNFNETSQLAGSFPLKTNEMSETTNKTKSSDVAISVANSLSDTLSKPDSDTSPKKETTVLVIKNPVNREEIEKCKYSKKKKLSELDKIHADLESYHGLDDIMKCSGLRACRLKNEPSGALRGSSSEENQNRKRRVTVSTEETFFIEDEITIKMEPIPELTYDLIKQESDYF